MTAAPVLVFLAGPNGAGKSTFFDEYLAHLGLPYVNADRVAAALRAADATALPDEIDRRAFSVAEAFRGAFVDARLSFCTESVFYRLVAVYERGKLVRRPPPLPLWTRGLPGR